MSERTDLTQGGTLIRVEGATLGEVPEQGMTYNNAAARLPASEEPTPRWWPLSAGWAADDEDAEYDWDQAG